MRSFHDSTFLFAATIIISRFNFGEAAATTTRNDDNLADPFQFKSSRPLPMHRELLHQIGTGSRKIKESIQRQKGPEGKTDRRIPRSHRQIAENELQSSVQNDKEGFENEVLSSDWWVEIEEVNRFRSRRGHSSTLYQFPNTNVLSRSKQNSEEKSSNDENSNENNMTGDGKQKNFNNNGRNLTKEQQKTTISANNIMQEYMIVSGGFGDKFWNDFDVYAFDMTSSINTEKGEWINITPRGENDDCLKVDREMTTNSNSTNLWDSAISCTPPGRLGHISAVYNNYLYIFGGLLFDDESGVFSMEDEPYMYRTKILADLTEERDVINPFSKQMDRVWERIIPNVRAPPPYMDLGGDGGTNKYGKGGYALPKDIVNRGEVRGGYWKEKLVIYGGLHVRDVVASFSRIQQVDVPMGDVWSYDFETDTWEIMASSLYSLPSEDSDPSTQIIADATAQVFPRERTSHAVAIVGDELIVYGGLAKLRADPWDGTTIWDELDDVWIFDLNRREWRERVMTQSLSRSYHSLVGWESTDGNGPIIASFGGFKTVDDPVSNDPISYVFDDTLVSYPTSPSSTTSSSSWMKASRPESNPLTISNRYEHSSVLSKASGCMFVYGGRFKYTESGVWIINLGAVGDTNVKFEIAPPDGLDDYNETVAALYVLVTTIMFMSMMFSYMCGILRRHQHGNNEEGENALDETGHAFQGDSATVFGRRRGLRQDVIESLPIKKYRSGETLDSENFSSSDQLESTTLDESPRCESDNNGNAVMSSQDLEFDYGEDSKDEECCPICLVDYKDGDELRTLPCNHEFHKDCVDPWLGNNTTCPACRYSLRSLQGSNSTNVSNMLWPLSQLLNSNLQAREGSGGIGDARNQARGMQNLSITELLRVSRLGSHGRRWRSSNFSSNANTTSDQNDNGQDATLNHDELDLPYTSSLELTQEISSARTEVENDNDRTETAERDLPIHGQRRRMIVSSVGNRGRRIHGRRSRRRGQYRSALNDPLQTSDINSVV